MNTPDQSATANGAANPTGEHTVPFTPPSTPGTAPSAMDASTPSAASSPTTRRRAGSVALTALLATVGAVVLTAGGTGAALAGAAVLTRGETSEWTVSEEITGVTNLNIDIGSSVMKVTYGDVTQAELTVTGNRADWSLAREGDTLTLSNGKDGSWWFDNWWASGNDSQSATLTLPESLSSNGLDANLSVGAGALIADGDFANLTFDVGAGFLSAAGSVQSVAGDVSVGRAELEIADVQRGRLSVSAGEITGTLSGRAPDSLGIEVSIGSVELTVPDEEYTVHGETSTGSVENNLRTSPGADHEITAAVSAGDVTLHAAD